MTRMLAAALMFGPLSGPLALAAYDYAKARRWGMALVCLIAIAEVWAGLALLEAWLWRTANHV